MGMAFFGPALVLLTIFLFLPMILTLIFSFTDFFALNPGLTHFVGLDNYIQIFKDDVFSQAFFNTVKFVIIIVPLQGIGALVLALLINKVYFSVRLFLFRRDCTVHGEPCANAFFGGGRQQACCTRQ